MSTRTMARSRSTDTREAANPRPAPSNSERVSPTCSLITCRRWWNSSPARTSPWPAERASGQKNRGREDMARVWRLRIDRASCEEVFHPIEQVATFHGWLVAFQLCQLAEQLVHLLTLFAWAGCDHPQDHDLIATDRGARCRKALSLQADRIAALRLGGDLDLL